MLCVVAGRGQLTAGLACTVLRSTLAGRGREGDCCVAVRGTLHSVIQQHSSTTENDRNAAALHLFRQFSHQTAAATTSK